MKNKALFLTATGPMSGKNGIALGVMQMLSRNLGNVTIFRPIIGNPLMDEHDPDIRLILEYFKIHTEYKDTFAYTQAEAKAIINRGSRNMLLENIIQKFKKVLALHDFVLCVGTDYSGRDTFFEFELNAEIASNLGCPVMLVTNGENTSPSDLAESIQLTRQSLQSYALDVLSIVINKCGLGQTELDELRTNLAASGCSSLIYGIPPSAELNMATMADVQKSLDARIIFGASHLDTLAGEPLIGAMGAADFLKNIKKDQLVVTPADRTDIVLAAIGSRLSPACPDIAGILLTDGGDIPDTVRNMLDTWNGLPLPILLASTTISESVCAISALHGSIEPGDSRKIDAALALYEANVNEKELMTRLLETRKDNRMTPLMFEFELIERAKKEKMRIVLCEGEDERILHATDILLRRDVADIILLGNVEAIKTRANALNLDITKARIINPVLSPQFPAYVNAYHEFRKAKGITEEQAREIMADSSYFGTMMVKLNDADGMVSGAVNTTAHTIRPAFEFIKTKPGFSVVSSVFLMCLKDKVLVFGDCAVNPNPTAQQLAEIAIASAHTAKVFGIEPRVAMLSYSTGKSGKGADVDLVVEATKIAKELAPELALEGPLQYDAAIDPIVAKTKLPGSQVAGKATVFIFPDLNTGNNTYKAVQRAADAIAIGPVLQGLKKPVNDLSRGCLVPDIVNTVAITAVQAAADRQQEAVAAKN